MSLTAVVLPQWGMGIGEATLTRWLKAVGDQVERGEPIAEIETVKAVEEVQAPVSGTLAKILVSQGETALVNTEIALIQASL